MEVAGGTASAMRRKIKSSFKHHSSSFKIIRDPIYRGEEDDQIELQWAAIQKLPTFKRIRTSLIDDQQQMNTSIDDTSSSTIDDDANLNLNTQYGRSSSKRVVDVTKLGVVERHLLVHKLIKHIDNDNLRFLQTQKERMIRVGVEIPTVEVRYKNLFVEAQECTELVQANSVPTLWNSLLGMLSVLTKVIRWKSQETTITILNDVSGIIKPSRLTLLLGPPGSGKTTLLLALAGKLDPSLKVRGEISYNGYKLDEFVPRKTSAYISQYDLHVPTMTVRETIDFSARCQGVGSRAEIMTEVSRREKEAGIVPDPDIDTYMKAISVDGQKRTIQTDYVLKILGLDICGDIKVGDEMTRGISGGQKKRLTTGEMIVGPTKALFMDEISNGLDSSTTFQIITCLQQLVHVTDATALVSLLQPAPETFDLFDDVILMAEGKIVYHGPRHHILQYFSDCGFKCPERKGAGDFLQEVISEKDQAQYWCHTDRPYNYVSIDQFSEMFRVSDIGEKLEQELSQLYDKSKGHKNALSFTTYSLGKWELFKACMANEFLLTKRNSFVYVFKSAQLIIIAFVTMTVFFRTRMAVDLTHANYFMSSLFYTLIRLMTNGITEMALTVIRLPVFYKQRDFYLYPAWAFAIPASFVKIPFALAESFLWTAITYYVIGYSPEVKRFFCQFLLLFALYQASTSMCRFVASVFKTMVAASTFGFLILILMFLFGGFIIPRPSLPLWLRWGFWLSPMSFGEIGITVNEFLAPRWNKVLIGNTTIGMEVLRNHGLNFDGYFYWISLGALLGFALLFDLGFVLALTYLKAPRISRAIISKKKLHKKQVKKECCNISVQLDDESSTSAESPKLVAESRKNVKMVLPLEQLTMTFKDVKYYIDAPQEMNGQELNQKKLELLSDITGALRPGILTALMGVSGAGKTTLMDVLSGRKTGGTVEGDIRIGGYPKVQKTFARILGYCEQYDIHSPQITVKESLAFSAWLRLPTEIDLQTKARFVEQVIDTIELDDIRDCIVGIPGETGLSTEQRKRLTIAVELVSNPSIIFMDEPTSGLDARAAAIVMRAVKNVVATGRTTVCTIHQPSIDVFEAFDELILMKRGGKVIYSGMLGHKSINLIKYFESIPGVPKIKDNYNPATWMLEVASASVEAKLNLDFAKIYKDSPLYKDTVELVRQLSEPPVGSKELHFPTHFSQNGWVQFRACLWKQHLSYWRSPDYNLQRFLFMTVASVLFGAVFWQKGQNINNEQDLFNILGSMYIAVIFLGINNCSSVLPYVETERTVLYREKFAGMYSSWAYSLAQVIVEIPYVLLQSILFVAITYPTIGYYWSFYKIFMYFYVTFCTFLYFVYLGMLIVSLSANVQIASILATAAYTILNLFSGFLMPGPKMPKWWVWCYWICPTAWSLNGLLSSQYGDINEEVSIFEERKTVSSFLEDYYSFRHDQLSLVAVILMFFPLFFASLFAYYIGKLNFQKR